MRVLVWQWGRFGGGPRFAAMLARGLSGLPGVSVALSLASGAELLRSAAPPRCDLPVNTYESLSGFLLRAAAAPVSVAGLARRIEDLEPDVAVCALAGPLDLLMAAALRRRGIPFVVVVHDADAHPGDGFPLQMRLQRALCRRAATLASLSSHVGDRLLGQRLAGTPGRPLIRLRHPPMPYDVPPHRAGADGTVRLLSFGRLLPYKGLDLLADGLRRLGPRAGLVVRVVGAGPESRELAALRALPGVTVENRWVPEGEVGTLLGWADALVLPYRESSQSGVAAAALAAHRPVLATNVGGLREQLAGEPLAILCEPRADSLADGLRRLLDRKQGARCPDPAANPLAAWQELGRVLVDQLQTLLRSGERRPAGAVIGRALPGWSE